MSRAASRRNDFPCKFSEVVRGGVRSAASRASRLLLPALMAAAAIGGAPALAAQMPLTVNQPIVIDGSFDDWTEVLANPAQITYDGDGSSYSTQCQFSGDKDCPQPGGTGNDFYELAWTYDANNVYLFIERYPLGSLTNEADLLFVADVNRDRKLDAQNDRVIHIKWTNGNNKGGGGKIPTPTWSTYVPAPGHSADDIACGVLEAVDSGGQSMCKNSAGVPAAPLGYVDGYMLPGSNPDSNVCTGCSGYASPDGLKVELAIPWSNFGVSGIHPFYWHAVSSNNGYLGGTVDNIGGPTGRIGSMVVAGVTLSPDNTGWVSSPGSVTYTHTLANEGNIEDAFNISAWSIQGAKLELIVGTDPNGPVIATDDDGDGTWDAVDPNYDRDHDGNPDIALALGGTQDLSIRITMPDGRHGFDLTTVTATSFADPTVSASALDYSAIASPVFIPREQAKGTVPGQAVSFDETLVNGESVDDTFDLAVTGNCPSDYAVDLMEDGTAVTSVGSLAALGGSANLSVRVTPPQSAATNTCSITLTATGATGAQATAKLDLTVGPPVMFTPDYVLANGTGMAVLPGGHVFFPGIIQNNDSAPHAYGLSTGFQGSDAGAFLRIWSDPNGDGNPSDGVLLFDGAGNVNQPTPSIGSFGGQYHVVVELQAGTAVVGTALLGRATATLPGTTVFATQKDEAQVGYLASYSDNLLTNSTTAFSVCSTVYIHAAGLATSNTTRYALVWKDGAGNIVKTVSPFPTTAFGTGDSSYTIQPGDTPGNWTVTLADTGANLGQLTFLVEEAGKILSFTTDKTAYKPGDPLTIITTVENTQTRATLVGTALSYVVQDVNQTMYMDLQGTFHSGSGTTRVRSGIDLAPGATLIDGFTVAHANYPAPGEYQVGVQWIVQCGGATAVLDSRSSATGTTPVTINAAPQPPVITYPAAGSTINVAAPTILGTGFPGATVVLTIDGGAQATVNVAGDGTFSVAASSLADGTHSIVATQTFEGTSSNPTTVTFTVDTVPPPAPVITSPDPNVELLTNALTLAIAGTAGGDAVAVALYDLGSLTPDEPVATAAVADGAFGFDLSGSQFGEGLHQFFAVALDAAGNMSLPSSPPLVVNADRTAPNPPILNAIATPTNADPVPVSGTAEAGSTVLVYDGATLVATVSATDGTFSANLSGLAEGTHSITATATDAAGNTSEPSAAQAVVVDRSIQGGLTITSPATGSTVPSGTVVVSGTTEPGATVTIVVDNGAPITVTAGQDGTFGTSVDVGEGAHTVSATATDAAGNTAGPVTVSFDAATASTDGGTGTNGGAGSTGSGDSGGAGGGSDTPTTPAKANGGGCSCGQGSNSLPMLVGFGLLMLATRRRKRA